MRQVLLMLLSLAMSAVPCWGDIYKCPDGKGGTRFQNMPCIEKEDEPMVITGERSQSPAPLPSVPPLKETPPQDKTSPEDIVRAARKAQLELRKRILEQVALEEVKNEETRHYITLHGKVRNNGEHPIDFVKIVVEWQDSRGTILETDYTYAVGSESLRPGQAKSWRITSPNDPRIRRYRYYMPVH